MLAISPVSVHHLPLVSGKPSIVFLRHLWLARWWKKCSCHQPKAKWNKSVDARTILRGALVCLSLFWLHVSYPNFPHTLLSSSSNSPCLALIQSRVLSKVFLLHTTKSILHCLIFSNKRNIGLPVGWVWTQKDLTQSTHSGCATHFSSNRYIFFLRQCRVKVGSVFSRMGSWSE